VWNYRGRKRKNNKEGFVSYYLLTRCTGETYRQPRDPKGYEKTREIVKVLQKFAERKKSTVTGIALAYVMAKVREYD
jgi:aryl-alcohol dehydrogenase-like predicted oxidoreductase